MNRRIMWEIGVEGDKFNPHVEITSCYPGSGRCVPLSDIELVELRDSNPAKWEQLVAEDAKVGAL